LPEPVRQADARGNVADYVIKMPNRTRLAPTPAGTFAPRSWCHYLARSVDGLPAL